MDLLAAHAVDFHMVDGADPEKKEERDELFKLSGVRGQYPQFFLRNEESGNITFFGNWDFIEQLNECNELPEDILKANPQIKTLDMVIKENGIILK